MRFSLHTDGGCYPNPGPGGWAFIIHADGCFWKQDSGRNEDTTNNRQELRAVLYGLEALAEVAGESEGHTVLLVSDSQYVTKGISQWRHSWKKYNWSGVANSDLWQLLDEAIENFDLGVKWIKGHAGDPTNEECDRLVTEAYRD